MQKFKLPGTNIFIVVAKWMHGIDFALKINNENKIYVNETVFSLIIDESVYDNIIEVLDVIELTKVDA